MVGLGLAAGALVPFLFAELYLWYFAPSDIVRYLGDDSGLVGDYQADNQFGLRFSSWEALVRENPRSLGRRWPLPPRRLARTWAFFGTSFAHELAGMVRKHVRRKVVFTLDRRETFLVRLAQIRMLLQNGFCPQRVFLTLMPIDVEDLLRHSISSIHITPQGALTYKPRQPPWGLSLFTRHSRVALTAWVRSGLHQSNPGFRRRQLHSSVPESLRQDMRKVITELGRLSQKQSVPLSLVFIPVRRQSKGQDGFVFQDVLVPMATQAGLDVVDPRTAFVSARSPSELYIPDGHLSDLGNRTLIAELLDHVSANSRVGADDRARTRQ